MSKNPATAVIETPPVVPSHPPEASPQAASAQRWAALAVFGASLVTYLLTLAPSVTGEDSGELVAAAYTLGIPHPPGYPLWCMVTKIFMTLLPFTDVAWRANFGSACTAAAATALMVPLLGRLGVRPLIAGGSAYLMAVSSTLWGQSVIAEVYALTFLTIVGLVYCLLAWRDSGSDSWMMGGALLTGLSLGAHHTILLLSPIILIYVIWIGGARLLDPRRLGMIVVALLAGLSVQLYIPLRAAANPAMNWGHPDNFERFWFHVTRGQYPSLLGMKHTSAATIGQLKALAGYLLMQWPWPITVVVIVGAIYGLVSMLRRDTALAIWLAAWFAVMSVGFAILLNFQLDQEGLHVAEVFFIPAWFVVVVLFSVGAEAVAEAMPAAAMPVGVLVSVLALAGLLGNWSASTMHGNDVARRYGEDMLATVPKDGILFTSADYERFPINYLQIVEGKRPDVAALDEQRDWDLALKAAELAPAAGGTPDEGDVARFLRESKRPVYSTRILGLVPGTAVQPVGLLYRTFGDPKQALEAAKLDAEAWKSYPPMPDGPWRSDWSTASILAAWDIARARSALSYQRDPKEALALVKDAAQRLPGDPVHMFNLGALLSRTNQSDASIEYFERAITLRPDYTDAHYQLVSALIHLGRWDEAQEAYARANRGNIVLGVELENALLKEKTARPQLLALRESIGASNDPLAWMRLAAGLAEFNHMADAEQAMRKAVSLAPNNAVAWRTLGMLEAQLGNRPAAIEAWQNALRIDPKSKDADAIRANLKMLGGKEQ